MPPGRRSASTRRRVAVAVLGLALASAGCSRAQPGTGSGSGTLTVRVVTAGCPVTRVGTPCPTAPVPGAQVLLQRSDSRQVVQVGSAGTASVTLPPGRYDLEVLGLKAPARALPTSVLVQPDVPVTADLLVDNGSR